MGEQRRNRRNLVQNIIITFLSLLAVLLFTRTQLYSLDLGGGKAPAAGPSQSAAPAAELTAPVRAAVTGDYGRYGSVAHDTGDSGFAEALDLPGYPLLGVQFHPERMAFGKRRLDTVDGAAIWVWFLSVCRGEDPADSPAKG